MIIKQDEWYEDVYNSYLDEYGRARDEHVLRWHPSGPMSITIYYDDGRVVEYDDGSRNTRMIRNPGHYDIVLEELDEDHCKEQFSLKLKKYLRLAGMTQNDLGEALNCSQSTISKYASGRALPDIWMLKRIARALNCSESSLIWFDSMNKR